MGDDTTWEQRLQPITHILTDPSAAAHQPLHSQFFIAGQIPCYLRWDYPPILCRKPQPLLDLRWGFSLFLRRLSRFGLPGTSWRSKCPYLQPPPLVLARGVEAARWGAEERREYFRRRLRRPRLGNDMNPLIPVLVPNLILFSLLLWDPFPHDRD
ncbi:uncharacterized protein LOC116206884 [Punica granatum]|uniref:Uncharacterized protein LOC116206884 n=2 Tax=Punica granatum TaxID=22663 RepID=A0A6P8DEB8_PUNGR|nr:uncharacterized protein LOC116206884 [Punica granatum]PKI50379.1 hypothetical protein CRG98_029207 [Punica granatum]